MTLISRLSGYLRDVVVANLFGASATIAADAFFVAFKIPNFFRRMFAEGAFSQAFVPILTEYKNTRGTHESRELIDRVAGMLTLVLVGLTALGVLCAPLLIGAFAPGFLGSGAKFVLASDLLRITFPYLMFVSLAALAGGILNTYGRFAVPAFTPVLLNLAMIAAAIWLSPRMEEPVTALAWGVFAGGVAQLAFQIPFLVKLRLVPVPRIAPGHEGMRRVLKLMTPVLFGASVVQLNLMVDTIIASFLVTGSVSWLYYADRLVEFPLGVFGIALSTAILPVMSERFVLGSGEEFSKTLDWALRWVFVIGIPSSAGLAVLAEPMLCTLFQYGRLGAYDVEMSGRALVAYGLGLLGFTLVKVLAPAFFARQDTRTPVRIAVIAMLSNMTLSLLLVAPLAHAGLALATTIAAMVNAGLLYRALRREGVYVPGAGWHALFARAFVAVLVMVAVLATLAPELDRWLAWSAGERIVNLLGWIVGGGAIYAVALWLAGLRPRHLIAS
jgi:putative peptidoglycan lipid II flippase